MFVTKETQESSSKFFAIQDINSRARAAYNQHKDLFTSPQHQERVARVDQILKQMVFAYTTAYQTARPQTRRMPAHTEVKYDRVVQHSNGKHQQLRARAVAELAELGLDLVYKPRTNSYSVHVI